ncbi:MAG: hypothetical protein JST17_14445 [Bacteroidetes bacterium]|nr:hypothetical protein [Bacteroidota bacterium]MBS1930690.1 hypothetical protein [Bacteroidota bacterium]
MKLFLFAILFSITFSTYSQSVFGYWYGYANVKTTGSANNYLVELILNPEKGFVKGVLNYYFKNTYRSIEVKGNYSPSSRLLSLYEIPIPYHASPEGMEVFCTMNLQATLRVAKAGSNLIGAFVSLPEYKYTCPDINFNLKMNADISKKDSVMKAISEYKEIYQVWKPTYTDTAIAVNIIPRKVVNYVIEKEYTERENVIANEIEVASDSLKVDFYDNGEVDGDSISIFFNNKLIAFHQMLSTKSVHFDLVLDTTKQINELAMFADNLGSIPPNTALMIIDDGKNRFEARLTSNLSKNATVQIKREKNFKKPRQ